MPRCCISPLSMNTNYPTCAYRDGHYVLPPLPYGASDLEPLLDEQTVLLHHDKHHASYVAGANEAADILSRIQTGELDPAAAPDATSRLAFNLGGHILHCLYWESISPEGGEQPMGDLADAINRSFGSMEGFQKVFRSVTLSVQGSGWGVLGVDPVSGLLRVFGICRHHDALIPGLLPVLACDVWEHAYYLRYHNNRAGYINSFLSHIDWKHTHQRLTAICHES